MSFFSGMFSGSKGSGMAAGAASGASAGAAFGPWGAVIGGVVGGAAGYMNGASADKKAGKAANEAAAAQSAYTNAGYSQAEQRQKQGYENALMRISPYEASARKNYAAYNDSIGTNGAEGYSRAKENFDADPFRAGTQDASSRAVRDVYRRYNGRGMGNSGVAGAAVSRTAADTYRTDVDAYRSRLFQSGGQGSGLATTMAQLDSGYGSNTADYALGRNKQLADTETNRLMQIYNQGQQQRQQDKNTIGSAAELYMKGNSPNASGQTAFGNMRNSLWGNGWGSGGGSQEVGSWGTYGQSWQPKVSYA